MPFLVIKMQVFLVIFVAETMSNKNGFFFKNICLHARFAAGIGSSAADLAGALRWPALCMSARIAATASSSSTECRWMVLLCIIKFLSTVPIPIPHLESRWAWVLISSNWTMQEMSSAEGKRMTHMRLALKKALDASFGGFTSESVQKCFPEKLVKVLLPI